MFATLRSHRQHALSSPTEGTIGFALLLASMAMLLILFVVNQR
ncbi:MAG: hypothetical protein R2748_24245 [Bryobacterales bacterium]